MYAEPLDQEELSESSLSSERYLAIDLGAESGRGVLGSFDGENFELIEVGRFATSRGKGDLCDDGVQRWDIHRIAGEIDTVTQRAIADHGALAGVGVDSWGVDVGFFDKSGKLLARPVCYRDDSHSVARATVFERVSEQAIWDATGIQSMPFNTLYQLEALKTRQPEILDQATSMLLIPDVINALMIGGDPNQLRSETTDAGTTQMMHPGAKDWNRNLLDLIGLPHQFLRPLVSPGTSVGKVRDLNVPIYGTCSHDTGSAVAATPARLGKQNWAFLSSGTWSLIGVELESPVLSHDAMHAGFSNEAGVAGTTRFLKNIMGLWLLQQCRHRLAASGSQFTYAELIALADESAPGAIIDATDERLLNPPDMIDAITDLCNESGQNAPDTPGAISRCCIESLALAYRRSLAHIQHLTGRKIECLHIVGGGSQNELLNQWTADACGVQVLAGPVEAAALGNILGQMIGAGRLSGWQEARSLSRRSFTPKVFIPSEDQTDLWAEREAAIVPKWRRTSR